MADDPLREALRLLTAVHDGKWPNRVRALMRSDDPLAEVKRWITNGPPPEEPAGTPDHECVPVWQVPRAQGEPPKGYYCGICDRRMRAPDFGQPKADAPGFPDPDLRADAAADWNPVDLVEELPKFLIVAQPIDGGRIGESAVVHTGVRFKDVLDLLFRLGPPAGDSQALAKLRETVEDWEAEELADLRTFGDGEDPTWEQAKQAAAAAYVRVRCEIDALASGTGEPS